MVNNSDTFYFKEDRRFYKWEGVRLTVNHRGINCTIDLGFLNRVRDPLLSQIKIFHYQEVQFLIWRDKGSKRCI